MRKIVYVILIAVGAFMSHSCAYILDKEPISSLNTGNYWQTDADINSAVSAMYVSFASAMARGYYDWGEVRGRCYEPYQSASKVQELLSNNIPTDNSACLWTHLYKTINQAALIIRYVPQMTGASASLRTQALGEAYAMRALSYFYAVRVWGDVPLFKEAVEEYDINTCLKERESVQKVLDFIEADLIEAEKCFPNVNSSVKRTHANLGLVYALMMDVAAWRHDYASAVSIYENKVSGLPSSVFAFSNFKADEVSETWVDRWRSIVSEGTEDKEVFMMVRYDKLVDDTTNYTRTYFCSSGAMLRVSDYTLSLFEANDIRRQGTFAEDSKSIPKLEKFWERGNASITDYYSDNDLIMYRYTDIMLLYAEALNEVGGRESEAVAVVNKIRQRAGASVVAPQGKEAVRDAVLLERKLELLGEGKYWFDLVRMGKTESEADCPESKILFPISITHQLSNPLLNK